MCGLGEGYTHSQSLLLGFVGKRLKSIKHVRRHAAIFTTTTFARDLPHVAAWEGEGQSVAHVLFVSVRRPFSVVLCDDFAGRIPHCLCARVVGQRLVAKHLVVVVRHGVVCAE
jgi:hypothetical protein